MSTGNRRFAVVGSVFSIALGTGFVMQHGGALASRVIGTQAETTPAISATAALLPLPLRGSGSGKTAVQANFEVTPEAEAIQLPADRPSLDLPAAGPRALTARLPATAPATGLSEAIAAQSSLSEFGLPCDMELTATPAIAAMVTLSLTAPCQTGAAVTVSHEGLRFTEVTDATGALRIDVPALVETATFSMRFDDGATVAATATIRERDIYDRAVLQWQGQSDLSLHAFEYGANYGDPGHVQRDAPRAPARGPNLGAGFLTTLGSGRVPGAWIAEIYSFPAREAQRDGRVEITVEAAITSATCGREVRAETIQPDLAGNTSPVALTIDMPDCSAIGDFLVLKNLVQEMKVAAK